MKDDVISSIHVPEEKFQLVACILCLSLDVGAGDSLAMRVKRISPLLKQNGFFIAIICGEASFYKPFSLEEEKRRLFTLTKDDIKSAFETNGFDLEEHEIQPEVPVPRNDIRIVNCVLARKL